MSINSGRDIGEDGNLLLSHGLGVHGIQAIPVVALPVATGTATSATNWLHIAGIGWLAACTAALAQALLGHAPLEASPLTTLIVAGLALWAAGASHTLLTWRHTAHHTTPTLSPPSPGVDGLLGCNHRPPLGERVTLCPRHGSICPCSACRPTRSSVSASTPASRHGDNRGANWDAGLSITGEVGGEIAR